MAIFRTRTALGNEPALPEESIAELFHENTKLSPYLGAGGALVPEVDHSVAEILAMANAYKSYAAYRHLPLPPPASPNASPSFDEVLAARRTVRAFSADGISLAALAKLLRQSYGVTDSVPTVGGGHIDLRAAPSAGALYPAEIYLGVRAVHGLEPGLYHYDVRGDDLAQLRSGDPAEEIRQICCGQDYARLAALTILISGVLERPRRKYGERGYRYMLLDTGHLAENLSLSATALGLATTTTCGFFDDQANDLLGLDGIEESVLYVVFLGTKCGGVPASPVPAAD